MKYSVLTMYIHNVHACVPMYYVCSYSGTCIVISDFNRFVINKLSLNIISHVGARYNCKKTELGIWDNGVTVYVKTFEGENFRGF